MNRFIFFVSILLSFRLGAQVEVSKFEVNEFINWLDPASFAIGPKCEVRTDEVQLKDLLNKTLIVSVLSYDELDKIFKMLASQEYIPFKYPEDGCYARAHEMSRILEEKGIITAKVFIEGNLRVETTNSPKGYVEWWYHVAPVVKVKEAGKEAIYVIDPSIFNKPMPVEKWFEIQTSHDPNAVNSKETYYNERFHYQPMDKNTNMSEFRKEDLEDVKDTMKRYMLIQEDRIKEKK